MEPKTKRAAEKPEVKILPGNLIFAVGGVGKVTGGRLPVREKKKESRIFFIDETTQIAFYPEEVAYEQESRQGRDALSAELHRRIAVGLAGAAGRTVWCPCPPGSVVVSILRHVLEELKQADGNGDDAEPESVPEKEEKPNE